jgi:N-acetylmuramic acid 6-phosphate etherase
VTGAAGGLESAADGEAQDGDAKGNQLARGGASVSSIAAVPTERRNPATVDVDILPTLEVLRLINAEDRWVPEAVSEALPLIAEAVEYAVAALRAGRRVHYFGAGTSGRLAVLDAAELPPTYGFEPGRIVAHHAGGLGALSQAIEDVEDDERLGDRDARDVRDGDVAIGISASGRTPYVAGALRAARRAGARTVLISSNPDAPLAPAVDVHIGVDTGPEVVTGSTRMKAGTAAKLVLSAFSTTVMIRLGRTYSNLMVSVAAINAKLRSRLVVILVEATGMSQDDCAAALARAGGDTRVALVSLLCGVPIDQAEHALRETGGAVREAMRRISEGRSPDNPNSENPNSQRHNSGNPRSETPRSENRNSDNRNPDNLNSDNNSGKHNTGKPSSR